MLCRVLLAVRSAKASAKVLGSFRDMHAESRGTERENRMHDHEDTPGRVTCMEKAAYLGASELNTSTHLGLMWALTLADQHAILGTVLRTRFNFSLTDCAIYRFYSRLQYCTGEDGVDQLRLRRFYGGLVHLPGAGLHVIQKPAKLVRAAQAPFLQGFVPNFLSAWRTGAYMGNYWPGPKLGHILTVYSAFLAAYLPMRDGVLERMDKCTLTLRRLAIRRLFELFISVTVAHALMMKLAESEDVETRREAFDALRERRSLEVTSNPTLSTFNSTTHTPHPTPYTLHPAPHTLHPTPYTLHLTPLTPHPTPHTLSPTPYTLHPTPHALHHGPSTLYLKP